MYFLERKERCALPNILGNKSFPVPTWQWKQVAVCEEKEPLETLVINENYRIISNNPDEEY